MANMASSSAAVPRRARVKPVVTGACAGCAAGAGSLAVLAAVATWIIKSPQAFLSRSVTGLVISALIVVAAASLIVLGRCAPRGGIGFIHCFALCVAAWGLWAVYRVYRSRDALRFSDSTGATLLAAAAMLAAMMSLFLVLAARKCGDVPGRRAGAVALVITLIALPGLTGYVLHDHRSRVWYPDIANSAATTNAGGPVDVPPSKLYSVSLPRSDYRAHIAAAGDNVLVHANEELTVYDSVTGKTRWSIPEFGYWDGHLIARRNTDDPERIVAVLRHEALIGIDSDTGDVLWRRQFSGEATNAAGGIDALGIVVFDEDSIFDRTHLYSIDPASGKLRWSTKDICAAASLRAGLPGMLEYNCSGPSLANAHTGHITAVEGESTLRPGDEVYVGEIFRSGDGPLDRTHNIAVYAADGRIIDEFPGEAAVSPARDGYLLAFTGDNQWQIRNYRTQTSTPVSLTPFSAPDESFLSGFIVLWVGERLLVTSEGRDNPLLLIDPAHTADPLRLDPPCPASDRLDQIVTTPRALVALCRSSIVGLARPK